METITNSDNLAQRIVESLRKTAQARDTCVAQAFIAVNSALDCGDLINQAKVVHRGEFKLWFDCHCRDESGSQDFSFTTAERYAKIAKYRAEHPEECLSYDTFKQYYIATGLMPAPLTPEAVERPPAPPFKIKFFINDKPLEEWAVMDLREFLENPDAKKVHADYEKAMELEKSGFVPSAA